MSVPSFDSSPDVDTYTDITLVDLDPQEMIDNFVAYVADRFPGWIPREDNTEVVVAEALIREAQEMVYAINQLAPSLLEAVLSKGYGIPRSIGQPPTASIQFTVIPSSAGRIIPAGTTVLVDDGNTDEPLALITDLELAIAPNAATGVVSATGSEASVTADGVAAGAQLTPVDALAFVESATLATDIVNGREPESGDEFLRRAAPMLSRLNSTLVNGTDIEAYVAENRYAYRVKVVDLYNPKTPGIAPGGAPGYITIAVAGEHGASYSDAQLETMADNIRVKMHGGLIINVVNTDTVTVDVAVTVLRFANADNSDVAAAVEAKVRDYLNPDTWPWSGTVRVNEIIAAADSVPGVDAVLSVTAPSDNVTLTGVAPLAKVGTVTVTVQAP